MYTEVEILGSYTQKFQLIKSGGFLYSAFLTNSPGDSDVDGPGTTPGEGWLCNSSEIVTEPSSACHPLLAQLLLNIFNKDL